MGLLSATTSRRSTTLIVPAPGGSRTGVAGRILAASLERELGRPIEVLNTDGPAQGYELLAAAPPDGSTIGLVAADLAALHWAGKTDVRPQSVTPLALFNEDPAGIHVRRDARWQNARELAASIRSAQGRMNASGAGRAAIWHVSTHRWMTASGLGPSALPWEPAAGPAAAAEILVAGGPDVVVCSVPEIRTTRFAKDIKTLAVMARGRSRRYPEIAALAEAGVPVRAGLWRGVAAPKGTPPQVAGRVTAALRRAYAGASFRREMFRRGFGLAWAETAEFAQFMDKEDRVIGSALRAIG
jgi:tripartite-type tricarboxylate transporter receptor subunit TctC